eukprot:554889-Hanusia_phi.AAC.11
MSPNNEKNAMTVFRIFISDNFYHGCCQQSGDQCCIYPRYPWAQPAVAKGMIGEQSACQLSFVNPEGSKRTWW